MWTTALIVALAGVSAVPSAAAADCEPLTIVGDVDSAVRDFVDKPNDEKPGAVSTLMNTINGSIVEHGFCAGEPNRCVLDFEQSVYGEFAEPDGTYPPIALPGDFGSQGWQERLEGYVRDLADCLQ